jgi:hypothetical protein
MGKREKKDGKKGQQKNGKVTEEMRKRKKKDGEGQNKDGKDTEVKGMGQNNEGIGNRRMVKWQKGWERDRIRMRRDRRKIRKGPEEGWWGREGEWESKKKDGKGTKG